MDPQGIVFDENNKLSLEQTPVALSTMPVNIIQAESEMMSMNSNKIYRVGNDELIPKSKFRNDRFKVPEFSFRNKTNTLFENIVFIEDA